MKRRARREFDIAYRGLFNHPEVVEDLLQHFVNEPWIADLDFKSLHRESELSIARSRNKIRDAVWSVRFRDRTLYVLILIEFQSRPNPIMALRQLIYVATFYEDLYKQKLIPPGGKLPPVLPIVLYNGEEAWPAPQSVEEMIEDVPAALARYQPRMSYFFLDERHTRFVLAPEDRNTMAALLALVQGKVGEDIFKPILALVHWLREPKYESLRQAFKDTILLTLPEDFAPLAEIFDHPEADVMTTRQHLENWYQQQQNTLRAEGRVEGRFEGRVEGQRSLLEKQLRLKFGSLDAKAKARLAKADSAHLDLWAERVLTAGSLSEVWA